MNTTDLTPLPARPSLEQYKKQAKDLLKLATSGDPVVLERIQTSHPHPGHSPCCLADAQLVIAREHGFESWPRFSKHIEALTSSRSPVSQFEAAADAIVTGDEATLKSLLRENPKLVRERSSRVHRVMLLHYVSANGFENYRQKTAPNAVSLAKLLLDAGADVDAVADTYGKGTTLGLVATSEPPKRAGVQIALLEFLLDRGASVNGAPDGWNPLVSALHNGRGEAAEFLAARGASLDLEGAAGVGRLDQVESLFPNATKNQIEAGFLWACEYGRYNVVDFLLNHGVDLDARQNTGLTGLHWAIVGGHLDTVRLLLERGARLETMNVYGGTALGQALWAVFNVEPDIDYVPILETLLAAGAVIGDGSLTWLAQQSGRSATAKERVAEVLRRHGAQS